MDCSLPASSVHGTFLGRILEWVTISSSRASSLLPDPGIEPGSPVSLALQAASLPLSHQGNPSFSLIQTRNSWQRRQMCCTVGYRQKNSWMLYQKSEGRNLGSISIITLFVGQAKSFNWLECILQRRSLRSDLKPASWSQSIVYWGFLHVDH